MRSFDIYDGGRRMIFYLTSDPGRGERTDRLSGPSGFVSVPGP
jgi:hypothetical protein